MDEEGIFPEELSGHPHQGTGRSRCFPAWSDRPQMMPDQNSTVAASRQLIDGTGHAGHENHALSERTSKPEETRAGRPRWIVLGVVGGAIPREGEDHACAREVSR